MSGGLYLAPGLALDPDYVGGGTFALLAKKGAGKTYTGRVLAEEFWKAKVPFVALDPMDAWWGLRAAADGNGDGIPVAIFGGKHGDAPLERTGGKLMADLVVDEGLSAILSLSELGSRAAERQFAMDFLERLYRRNSDLVHLLIDEADLFAPQKPQSGDQPLLGVTENIVRRGRNKGIGITLITQRPAVLNKDVLTQVDGLVAMRMLGPQDRNAIDAWVGEHGDDQVAGEIKGSLPDLQNGECWWWIPELGVLKKVQVRRSRTFDSSPTKRRGEKRREPKGFADVDMGAIEERMAATIERQKAEDPKELRKQVADLQRQVRALEAAGPREVEPKSVEVEVPVAAPETLAALRNAVERASAIEERGETIVSAAQDARLAAAHALEAIEKLPERPATARASASPRPRPTLPSERRAQRAATPARTPAPAAAANGDGPAVSGPQQGILDALAWFEAIGVTAPKRTVVAAVAGVSSKSSGFRANVSTLSGLGLLSYPTGGQLALTDDGRRAATPPPAMPTVEQLQDEVCSMVSGPQATLLRELIAVYPEALSREELAERAGVSAASSGFRANISTLSGLELVGYPGGGYVAASPMLFPEGVAR